MTIQTHDHKKSTSSRRQVRGNRRNSSPSPRIYSEALRPGGLSTSAHAKETSAERNVSYQSTGILQPRAGTCISDRSPSQRGFTKRPRLGSKTTGTREVRNVGFVSIALGLVLGASMFYAWQEPQSNENPPGQVSTSGQVHHEQSAHYTTVSTQHAPQGFVTVIQGAR